MRDTDVMREYSLAPLHIALYIEQKTIIGDIEEPLRNWLGATRERYSANLRVRVCIGRAADVVLVEAVLRVEAVSASCQPCNPWRKGFETDWRIAVQLTDAVTLYRLRDAEAVRYGIDVEVGNIETAKYGFCCHTGRNSDHENGGVHAISFDDIAFKIYKSGS